MVQEKYRAISEICTVIAGHSFRGKPRHNSTGNVCVVQPKDITSEGVLYREELCRTDHIPKKLLCAGDVLLINRGRFTAAVFDGTLDMPCVTTAALMILTPNDPSELLSDYLALYLNSREGQSHFKRLTDASTTPFISRTNVESFQIPLPSLTRQQQLVTLGQMKQRYAALTTRKTELINNLINCELTTPA